MDANQGATSVLLLVFCFTTLAMLATVPHVFTAAREEESSSHLHGRRRDSQIDKIIKNAESVTYPPDDYWKEVQMRIPLEEPFPCEKITELPKWRSEKRPQSVHELRPGDIDVIGAMGDSLTCGNGGREFNPMGVLIQDRGISYSGGGLGTWREIITLPNILKVFNPKLIGYSLGRGDFGSYNAQLNVAIPASYDVDMLKQAKLFVSKMRRDPRINITTDWKLLTIHIGQNDLCSRQCFSEGNNSTESHRRNLQKALDYLYASVPRIFVNLLSTIDITITARVNRSTLCKVVNVLLCPCLFYGEDFHKNLVRLSRLAQEYQEVEKDLTSSNRYKGRNDFTVEWQPFFRFMNMPKNQDDRKALHILESYNIWTSDCVHLNQKGMVLAAKWLWQNMMEPSGNKTEEFEIYPIQDMKCPTKNAPYLFTKENSKDYL